jgi:hypothetical protein
MVCLLGIVSFGACSVSQATPTPVAPTATLTIPAGFTENEAKTLASLKQVDDYPLYTMQYYGEYDSLRTSGLPASEARRSPWACSLFTALLDEDHLLYGRNFDWEFSPALLLFTDPPDGYASVSMVSLASPRYTQETLRHITDIPLAERRDLLYTALVPYDGMNEYGLAIGMAKVPDANMQADPSKKTIGGLTIMREILDHARDVDEAVEIIKSYNIYFPRGLSVHYLIADAKGRSVLVEYFLGKMYIIPNEQPWHYATNFLVASTKDPLGHDVRYDRINARLSETQGKLDPNAAMDLLSEVSQGITQWSVVYQMARGEVHIAMGRDYENVLTFRVSDYFDPR